MKEIWYVSNPDTESPSGFLEVPVADIAPTHHNTAHADYIERALAYAQVDDPQARVMASFYRGGPIPRELMDAVEPTIDAVDVADQLSTALYRLEHETLKTSAIKDDGVDAITLNKLADVLESENLPRKNIRLITKDGLLASLDSKGYSEPYTSNATDHHELDKNQQEVADELYLNYYGFEHELIWNVGEEGNMEPVLQSDRQHFALGRIGVDGKFEHVVTVLDPKHPVLNY